MVSAVCAITSDRGTEAGYPQAPSFAFHDLFPYLSVPAFRMDVDDMDSEPEQTQDDVPHILCLQGSLPIPGCLHIVHNATRNMLSAMPNFEAKTRAGFTALVQFLHQNFSRQRFLATCIEPFPDAQAFAPLFQSFSHTVVKWRFGTLAAVCADLLPLEVPLRRFWNLDRMNFQQPRRQQEAMPAAPDNAFGDNRLEGANLDKVSEAVFVSVFLGLGSHGEFSFRFDWAHRELV